MKVLITGASGFIGSFIVDEALARGMEVWAAVRKSSSRQWLSDSRIHLIELNLASQSDLEKQLHGHDFDYVVHAAGVTKCTHSEDFHRINTVGTQNLVRAIQATGMPLRRFIYLSSLSIFGPIREQQPYKEITESDTPQPNTAYGKSKLGAEQWLASLNQPAHSPSTETSEQKEKPFPYIILRPTGVYGPREKDYFMMAQSIKRHIDFSVGYKPQDITFVYVRDVVQAVFLAMEGGEVGRAYFLSDGQVYSSRAFSDLIISEMGHPFCLRIKAPLWVLRVATSIGEYVGRLTGHISALNNDKYHILSQRNWRCDITPARKELGFDPQYTLEDGVSETIAWYFNNGWL